MTKYFKKSKKNPFLWPFSVIFAKIWVKINFPGKKTHLVFRPSYYLASCKKPEKTKDPFLRKMLN